MSACAESSTIIIRRLRRRKEASPSRVFANTMPVMTSPPPKAPIMNMMIWPSENAVSPSTPSGPWLMIEPTSG